MFRSLLAVLVVAALSVGCVTISGPTASPAPTEAAATPSKAPTVAPTVAPTATPAPTSTPTATATAQPSAPPSAPPTVAPTVAPTAAPADFDRRDLLFHDDFSDSTSGWATGTVTGASGQTIGTIGYEGDQLRFDLQETNGWLATSRVTGSDQSVMRIAAQFVPQGAGRFGLLCDSSDTDEWGAIVDTDGTWLLGKLTNSGFDSKVKEESSGLNIPTNQSTLMAVECAALATGKVRVTLWMDGTGPVAVYETNDGPDTFNRAGVYAESRGAPVTIDVGDMLAFGDNSADGTISDAAVELMTHIPVDWVDSCYQSLRPPLYGQTAEAVVTCFIRKPGAKGAEIAEYASYLSADEMNSAYQLRISAFGSGAGGNCESSSGEQSYNIGGEESGRLLCVEQFRGLRFDWTDTRLTILSSLVDFDGSYSDTLADWQAGGPNP